MKIPDLYNLILIEIKNHNDSINEKLNEIISIKEIYENEIMKLRDIVATQVDAKNVLKKEVEKLQNDLEVCSTVRSEMSTSLKKQTAKIEELDLNIYYLENYYQE